MFIIKNLFPRTSNYRQEPLAAPLFKLCKGPTAKHSPAGQPWVGNEQPHSAAGQTRPQKSSEGRGQQSESAEPETVPGGPRWGGRARPAPGGRPPAARTQLCQVWDKKPEKWNGSWWRSRIKKRSFLATVGGSVGGSWSSLRWGPGPACAQGLGH